ncbi:MAG: hypothetical protein EXS06_01760 [Planctomycetaceae bacterium]|nr:hypothetical protein [Planctomycetaceae bacterium]
MGCADRSSRAGQSNRAFDSWGASCPNPPAAEDGVNDRAIDPADSSWRSLETSPPVLCPPPHDRASPRISPASRPPNILLGRPAAPSAHDPRRVLRGDRDRRHHPAVVRLGNGRRADRQSLLDAEADPRCLRRQAEADRAAGAHRSADAAAPRRDRAAGEVFPQAFGATGHAASGDGPRQPPLLE